MKNYQNLGWVRLHRKIEENFLWFLEPFSKAQAWIDLFLNANHKDGTLSIRGNIVEIKRGQIGWSELTMSERWSWSKNKVRRFLKLLETKQQIVQQKSSFTTVITVLKYEEYQQDIEKVEQQTIQQKDSRRYSRRYTNKNDKNDKNDKEINNTSSNELVQTTSADPTPKEFSEQFFQDFTLQENLISSLTEVGMSEEFVRKEIFKFIDYWTERNKSGTKQRWEIEKTFEIRRRLNTWFRNTEKFSPNKINLNKGQDVSERRVL